MIRTLLCIAFLGCVSCSYPTSEQNKQSRRLVSNATEVQALDQDTVNQLLKAAQDGKNIPYSSEKIYSTDAEVISTEIRNDSRDPEGHGRIRLTGRLPDNVAVRLDCYFADQDRAIVENIIPREIVHLRGELIAVYDRTLIFQGCVMESK